MSSIVGCQIVAVVQRFEPVPVAVAVVVPMVDAIVDYIVRMVIVVSIVNHRMDFLVESNQQTMLVIHNHHEMDHRNFLGYYCIANIVSQMLEKLKKKSAHNFIDQQMT